MTALTQLVRVLLWLAVGWLASQCWRLRGWKRALVVLGGPVSAVVTIVATTVAQHIEP